MPMYRNYARYGAETTFYRSISEFLNNPIVDGACSIQYGDYFLDLMIWNRHAPTTIVVFHAAANLDDASLPIFIGQHLLESAHANVVFCSDPSLDLDAPIGWFAGDNRRPLQQDFPRIINYIHEDIEQSQHLVFFGPSAGGFAALYYSHIFPDSLAIVANPQTNIDKYHAEAVQKYLERCWDAEDIRDCPFTSNLIPLYQSTMNNHVLYLQNLDDQLHVEQHFKPWSEVVKNRSDRWQLILGDWGEGHFPVPAFLLTGVLGQAVAVEGDWPSLLADPELLELSEEAKP